MTRRATIRRLAILALLPGLCLAQSVEERNASLDAIVAAEWQHKLNTLKSQVEAGRVAPETFRQTERESMEVITRLRRQYTGAALRVYDRDFQRALRDLARGVTPTTSSGLPERPRLPVDLNPLNRPYLLYYVLLGIGAAYLIWAVRTIGKAFRHQKPAVSNTFGTAAYAEPTSEIPHPMYLSLGVFFGKSSSPKISPERINLSPGAPICSLPENHTLICGRTRAGKGTRVAVPTLLRYFSGSMLVIDPKGENAAITARARSLQNTVYIVNPWGELGEAFPKLGFKNATYNPLDILDRNDPNAVAIAQGLAGAICPTKGGDKEKFWQSSAANVLAAVLLWITDQPGETKTLARAREIVSLSRRDFKDQFLVKMAASGAFGGAIREMAAQYIDLAQETYSGVMANLAEATKFLSDPQVKASTAISSFSMDELAGKGVEKPVTVYLVIPPDRMDTQRTWLRLLITAGMYTFKRRPPEADLRCMFLIDEFPALGRLDELPRDIATMAGYGVDFTLIVQGLDQLKEVYGEAHATILNNCAYKWFCAVNDLHSAEYVSKTLGNATVPTTSQSQSVGQDGGFSSSTSHGETGRPLLMPNEVLNLGRDKAILLAPNSLPHFLLPVDYWKLPEAFASMREEYPHLYWKPPLQFDPNPRFKGSDQAAALTSR